MCLNFFLIKIGCDNENTIKIDTSILVDVVNTVIQTNVEKAVSNTAIINTLVVNNNGTFNCPGGFTISQTNNINETTINNVNIVQSAEINTSMVNNIKDTLSQEQTQGILAFLNSIGQAGSVTNSTQITNRVQESVRNAVTQAVVAEAINGIYVNNTLTLNNNGLIEGGSCNIVQSNPFDIRVTNLATTVQTTLQNDAFLNDLLTYVKQTQKSSDLSWVKWIFIAGIAVVALIIIVVLFYFIFGSKGGGTKQDPKLLEKQRLENQLRERRANRVNRSGTRGDLGSRGDLESIERGAEARTAEARTAEARTGSRRGISGGYLSPEAEEGIRNVANRFGRFVN